MTDPLEFPTGAPIWVDLNSHDPDASKAFYETLFGWTSTTSGPEFGNYVTFSLDGKVVGGMVGNAHAETVPDFWTVYLESDDAETTAEAITSGGGQVIAGPDQVGPLGSMVIASDPGRAVVGAWQRGVNRGFEGAGEVNGPAWFELHTAEYYDSVEFYQQAFGWQTATMGDSDEFRYTQLMVGETPYAGIYDATVDLAGSPAFWLVYFRVADADVALAKAVELGATVLEELVDTPFGRMAKLADPTGAVFRLSA